MKKSLSQLILLSLVLVLGASLATQTVFVNRKLSFKNRYELGMITASETLIFEFTFPNPSQVPTTFTPSILNVDFGPANTGPALSPGGALVVPTSPGKLGPVVWGPAENTGIRYLQLGSVSSIASLQVVLVTVRRQGERDPYKAYADFLRHRVSAYIYLAQKSD